MSYEEFIKLIGFNIKIYRLKRNLTQFQLAEMINVNEKYIGKIESGKQNITLKTLHKLLTALNVEYKDIVKE